MSRWSRQELLLALNLYFETPFGKQHKTYPPIVELASKLGRTPSAVGMKLCNFTSLDASEAERGIKGLTGASNLDREIWAEFQSDRARLVNEIESILEEQAEKSDQGTPEKLEQEESIPQLETARVSWVEQRRYQNFFRRIVLRSYSEQCCITANPIPQLLRASHIVPWSQAVEQRLNPRNGICLSATFDVAFDRGLITFTNDFRLLVSDEVKDYESSSEIKDSFLQREGMQIRLPEKNLPDPNCLTWHREHLFQR
jgi:putative restriction endonuclease